MVVLLSAGMSTRVTELDIPMWGPGKAETAGRNIFIEKYIQLLLQV